MKRLLGLLMAMMVMMGGMAGAQASTDNASMQLIRMNPLAFRKEPVELYSVTHTPNGSFVASTISRAKNRNCKRCGWNFLIRWEHRFYLLNLGNSTQTVNKFRMGKLF